MTSSTSFLSSWGALPSTSVMQWAARSDGRVMLNEPRWDLASGVRELATTTASLMAWLLVFAAETPCARRVGTIPVNDPGPWFESIRDAQRDDKGPSAALAPSSTHSTYRKYASCADFGRRLAAGPFSSRWSTFAQLRAWAAIHDDGRTRHEGRRVRGEEDARIRDLFHLAPAAHADPARHRVVGLLRGGRILLREHADVALGLHGTRRDAVDANVLPSPRHAARTR